MSDADYPQKVHIKKFRGRLHVFENDKFKPKGSNIYIQEKEMKRKLLQNEQRLHDALDYLLEQVVDDVPQERRSKHLRMAIAEAKNELNWENENDA